MLPLALAALATPLPPTAAGWRVPALVRPSWTTPPRAYRAPLALYTSDACVGHQPSSRTKPHPEQPERLANLLRALQHGQGAVLASPQLGSSASSGRIWRLWAVWHCQGEASPATASGARASRLPEPPISPPLTMQALRTKWEPEFGARMLVREPRADVTDAQLLRVHTLAHTAKVELALSAAKGMQRVNLDSDTIASPGTRAAARRAAGLVVAAVDEVMQPVLTLTLALVLTLTLALTQP